MSGPERTAVTTPRRESSDFSIERILAKGTSLPSSTTCKDSHLVLERTCTNFRNRRNPSNSTFTSGIQNKLEWLKNFHGVSRPISTPADDALKQDIALSNSSKSNDSDYQCFSGEELSWLRCTRYHPPKLPRKSSSNKCIKRQPGSQPRIPFTKYQVEILEDKYKKNAYLSRKDVIHLSNLLELPQNRIKIWFQNRRARERRETQALQQVQATTI